MIESDRNYVDNEELEYVIKYRPERLDYLIKMMPTDKDSLRRVLSEIHDRIGYRPEDDNMEELNKYADKIIAMKQYINQSKSFLNNMETGNKQTDAIKEAISLAKEKKRKATQIFIYTILSDMKAKTTNSHKDSIIYDIIISNENNTGINVVLFGEYKGEAIICSKYITQLDDIVELSKSVDVNEESYDNFKTFKEITQPINTNMKSIYEYKKYKTPYSLQELETLLQKIYNVNQNRI